MDAKRKAVRLVGLAVVILFGGGFLALLIPKIEVEIAAAAFVGYVACTRRALSLSHADDLVFEGHPAGDADRAACSAVRAGLAAGTIGALALGRAAAAPRPRRAPDPRPRATVLRSLDPAPFQRNR